MAGDMELDRCNICGNVDVVSRRYYHYDIACECHGDRHFEIVKYCKDCADKVKPPREIKVVLNMKPID